MRALAISSTQDVSAFDQLQQAIAAFTHTRIKDHYRRPYLRENGKKGKRGAFCNRKLFAYAGVTPLDGLTPGGAATQAQANEIASSKRRTRVQVAEARKT
jgi:hypothetical protein